jgi:hypothetical protein
MNYHVGGRCRLAKSTNNSLGWLAIPTALGSPITVCHSGAQVACICTRTNDCLGPKAPIGSSNIEFPFLAPSRRCESPENDWFEVFVDAGRFAERLFDVAIGASILPP